MLLSIHDSPSLIRTIPASPITITTSKKSIEFRSFIVPDSDSDQFVPELDVVNIFPFSPTAIAAVELMATTSFKSKSVSIETPSHPVSTSPSEGIDGTRNNGSKIQITIITLIEKTLPKL